MFSCNDSENESVSASQDKVDNPNHVTTGQPDTEAVTSIDWLDSTNLNMGKINEGQMLEITYRFKNSGSKPLVISNVTASCGCTIPEKPKEPYAPGQEGVIKATFNSSGKVGMNSKQVTVQSNTNPTTTILTFNVEVVKLPG